MRKKIIEKEVEMGRVKSTAKPGISYSFIHLLLRTTLCCRNFNNDYCDYLDEKCPAYLRS